jgi:hypothetical protein
MVVKIHTVISCMWELLSIFQMNMLPLSPLSKRWDGIFLQMLGPTYQTTTWCQNLDDHDIDLSTNSAFTKFLLIVEIITVLPSSVKWIPLLTYVTQAEVRKVKKM